MRFINTFTGAVLAASLLAAPAVFAAATAKQVNPHELMQACDMSHAGTMSKAEMLAHMGRMFDQAGSRQADVPDPMQTEQLLRNITLEHN